MTLKIRILPLFVFTIFQTLVLAQTVEFKVGFDKDLGPMRMERMALGQGGLSPEPMLDGRLTEIRALNPAVIRIFLSEYYEVISETGEYHFDALDKMVEDILATGAKPFMAIALKPKLFFPVIDENIVEPNDYKRWEDFIYNLVRHYKDMGAGITYWEVGNEVDIGEIGGTPYKFNNPPDYVRYYKHTTAAVLRADPDAKVGGPALADYKSSILPELIRASSREKFQLDFVSWHHYNNDPKVFRSQIEYVKGLVRQYPDQNPELIMNEWNVDLFNPILDPRYQPCFVAETIWQMKDAGLDWSSYYHIRDWYVSYETFAKIHSRKGTAFMARWWNRQAQFSGLFDYQNNVRPAYFTFKLLARMAGNRLETSSSSNVVHGFAAEDPILEMYNLMLWNFSDKPKMVNLSLENIPRNVRVRHMTLDASPGAILENQRLRPDPFINIEKGSRTLKLTLEPWAVHYWSLE